ncbi:MAG: M23 family metallopeptidase [Alphaproteobacteria bacterium]|nr:M23 family metallopeptidase [Alphaproteobacteria bacterium]
MARRFKLLNNRLFRARNIIVVSEQGVKHYPLGAKLQFVGLLALMGFLSWASYSTGSYLSAKDLLRAKERNIEQTVAQNRAISEQFTILKQDLAKLGTKDGEELSEYERFVMDQHKALSETDGINSAAIGQNVLQARIDYLESMVNQMKSDRSLLVASIRERSESQNGAYEDLIESTGLNLAKLLKTPEAKARMAKIQADGDTKRQAANAVQDEELRRTKETTSDFANQGGPFEPANPSQLSADELRAEEAMFDNLDESILLRELMNVIPFAKPVANARVTSTFGRRVDPINKRWAIHKGMDFVGPYGGKVQATSGGTVTVAGTMRGYGNVVEIDHGYGFTTRYAHLQKVLVTEGQSVKKGATIGTQGNSGRSTGTHVHYEVRHNKTALNPDKFVKAGNHVF